MISSSLATSFIPAEAVHFKVKTGQEIGARAEVDCGGQCFQGCFHGDKYFRYLTFKGGPTNIVGTVSYI